MLLGQTGANVGQLVAALGLDDAFNTHPQPNKATCYTSAADKARGKGHRLDRAYVSKDPLVFPRLLDLKHGDTSRGFNHVPLLVTISAQSTRRARIIVLQLGKALSGLNSSGQVQWDGQMQEVTPLGWRSYELRNSK